MKNKLLLLPVLFLSGCATSIIDAGVFATTGKTTGSHVLSEYHKQDCNTVWALQGEEVCRKMYYGQTYHKKLSKDLLTTY